MAQKSSASRKGRTVSAPIDPEQPVGKHLFFDNKRRLIYVSPLLHKNLYLPKYDYKRFNRYNSRVTAASRCRRYDHDLRFGIDRLVQDAYVDRFCIGRFSFCRF